jgi:hypothetical protein
MIEMALNSMRARAMALAAKSAAVPATATPAATTLKPSAPAKATLTYPYNGNTKRMRINRNGNTFNLTLTNNGKGIKSGSVTKKGQTKRNFTVANITKNLVGNVAPAAELAATLTPTLGPGAAETPKNKAKKLANAARGRIAAAAPSGDISNLMKTLPNVNNTSSGKLPTPSPPVTPNGSPIGLPILPKLPTVEDAKKAKDNATKYVKNLSPNAPLPTMDDLMGKYRALTSTNAGEIIDTAEKKRKSNSDIGNLIRGGRSRRHKKHKSHKKRVAKRKTRKVNRRRY